MDVTTILAIIGLILTPLTGIVSWLAGTRSRRNSVYQELLATIKTLTEQNSELQAKVVKLQDEVIEVRKENAELKAGQAAMTRQMDELTAEKRELKELVTKNK